MSLVKSFKNIPLDRFIFNSKNSWVFAQFFVFFLNKRVYERHCNTHKKVKIHSKSLLSKSLSGRARFKRKEIPKFRRSSPWRTNFFSWISFMYSCTQGKWYWNKEQLADWTYISTGCCDFLLYWWSTVDSADLHVFMSLSICICDFRFDSEIQRVREELNHERTLKDKVNREKEKAAADKYKLEHELAVGWVSRICLELVS